MRDASGLPIRVPPACRSSTSRPIVHCYTNRAVQPVKSRALTSIRVISLDYCIRRETSVHRGARSKVRTYALQPKTQTQTHPSSPSSLASSSVPNFSPSEASRGGSHVPSTSPMWSDGFMSSYTHRGFHDMGGGLRASERRPSQTISDISDPPVYITCQVAG
jgi:hypothetical protein